MVKIEKSRRPSILAQKALAQWNERIFSIYASFMGENTKNRKMRRASFLHSRVRFFFVEIFSKYFKFSIFKSRVRFFSTLSKLKKIADLATLRDP